MKISGRVDSSVCGAVLASRPAAGFGSVRGSTRAISSVVQGAGRHKLCSPAVTVRCEKSASWILSTFLPAVHSAPRPKIVNGPKVQVRRSSAATASAAQATKMVQQEKPRPELGGVERAQLMELVGRNGEGSVQEHFDFHRDPYRRGYAQPDGPKLQVSDKKHDVEYPSREDTVQVSDEVQDLMPKLYSAIGQRLRHPNRMSLDAIYKLYTQLPEPRMLFLSWQWRSKLLKVMGTPPKRDMESMLRYFALVADVKNAGLTLRRTQWNFALAFATKYATRTTAQEMESALRLWREMERGANVMGNDVTFNVLFDVAAKSGNFTLADMIYKEMESRGIEFNRFHHVSLIHYFGLRLDSGGVRAAYKEMVDSGEMIDTIVLNCVISGLLRCGEETAAEETYQQMKKTHSLAADMPQRDYMMNKVVTRVLMMFTKVGKQHPELQESLQTRIELTPDLHTYKLLVQHFAIRVGNLPKVAQYLDEMKHLGVQVHPTIFLALFKGFYTHGGFPGSDWSERRLMALLDALYQAKDEKGKTFRIERWLVIWALRAVKRCSSNEVVLETFDAMTQRWDIQGDREQFMHGILENIVQGKDMKATRH